MCTQAKKQYLVDHVISVASSRHMLIVMLHSYREAIRDAWTSGNRDCARIYRELANATRARLRCPETEVA